MSVTAPEGTPPAGQGQQEPAAPAPAAPTAAPPVTPSPAQPSPGPWAADLEAAFQDPNTRAAVDQFMREKVQPRTTKLEQDLAATKDAQQLWEQFNSDPVAAYVGVTHELFGEDAAKTLLDTLQAQQQAAPLATPQQPQQPQQLDPRVEAAVAYIEQQKQNNLYESELNRIVAEHPEVTDPNLLHPFIASADGDFDKAYQLYTEFVSRFAPTAPPTDPPAAPPVTGSDTGAAAPASTPVAAKKQTIGEAIEEFMAEQRAAPAPPVLG